MKYESRAYAEFMLKEWKEGKAPGSPFLSKKKDFGQGWVFRIELEKEHVAPFEDLYAFKLILPGDVEFEGEEFFDSVIECKIGAWDAAISLIDKFSAIKSINKQSNREAK